MLREGLTPAQVLDEKCFFFFPNVCAFLDTLIPPPILT